MKLRWLVVSVAVLGMGAVQAQDTSSEKGKLSYAIGYQLGREMAERGVDLDVNTVVRGVQEGFAKRDPSVPPEEMRAAVEKMQTQMLEQARAEFEALSAVGVPVLLIGQRRIEGFRKEAILEALEVLAHSR